MKITIIENALVLQAESVEEMKELMDFHLNRDRKQKRTRKEDEAVLAEEYKCDLCERVFGDKKRCSLHRARIHKGRTGFLPSELFETTDEISM